MVLSWDVAAPRRPGRRDQRTVHRAGGNYNATPTISPGFSDGCVEVCWRGGRTVGGSTEKGARNREENMSSRFLAPLFTAKEFQGPGTFSLLASVPALVFSFSFCSISCTFSLAFSLSCSIFSLSTEMEMLAFPSVSPVERRNQPW